MRQKPLKPSERLIVALDIDSPGEAVNWVERLAPVVTLFKVGHPLLAAAGWEIIDQIKKRGGDVFLDLKFHDIPNSVAMGVSGAISREVRWLTVHALGGEEMIRAAVGAVEVAGSDAKIVAVTLLTSIDDATLAKIGLQGRLERAVERLAALAVRAGASGLVSSPNEVRRLRANHPKTVLITPGIRSSGKGGKGTDDQRRAASAGEAIRAGADYIVVGRPILLSPDPEREVEALIGEIESTG